MQKITCKNKENKNEKQKDHKWQIGDLAMVESEQVHEFGTVMLAQGHFQSWMSTTPVHCTHMKERQQTHTMHATHTDTHNRRRPGIIPAIHPEPAAKIVVNIS